MNFIEGRRSIRGANYEFIQKVEALWFPYFLVAVCGIGYSHGANHLQCTSRKPARSNRIRAFAS